MGFQLRLAAGGVGRERREREGREETRGEFLQGTRPGLPGGESWAAAEVQYLVWGAPVPPGLESLGPARGSWALGRTRAELVRVISTFGYLAL